MDVYLCVFMRCCWIHAVVFNVPMCTQCNVANVLCICLFICLCTIRELHGSHNAILLAMLSHRACTMKQIQHSQCILPGLTKPITIAVSGHTMAGINSISQPRVSQCGYERMRTKEVPFAESDQSQLWTSTTLKVSFQVSSDFLLCKQNVKCKFQTYDPRRLDRNGDLI